MAGQLGVVNRGDGGIEARQRKGQSEDEQVNQAANSGDEGERGERVFQGVLAPFFTGVTSLTKTHNFLPRRNSFPQFQCLVRYYGFGFAVHHLGFFPVKSKAFLGRFILQLLIMSFPNLSYQLNCLNLDWFHNSLPHAGSKSVRIYNPVPS